MEEKTKGLSRRAFLKWSSVLGGTATLGGAFVGCSSKSDDEVPSGPVVVPDDVPATTVQKDGWIPVACWADCGSRGYNRVFVKDGVIMHSGTDTEYHPDSFWTPQLRSCQKGKMMRKRVLGLDRLKTPVKRKNFTAISRGGTMSGIPNTDFSNNIIKPNSVNEHLRGKDEWVAITWEEALDTIADEFIRVRKTYGSRSIYSARPGSYNGYTDVYRALTLFGGFVQDWGAQSSGTWGGQPFGLGGGHNDTRDLINSDIVVLWGHNPTWSGTGQYTYMLTEIKKRYPHIRFISIDPTHNSTAVVCGVKQEDWWPVRVVTDHALVLGIIHELITQDELEAAASIPKADRKWLNWDYIDKYCFGFDSANFTAHPAKATATATMDYVAACNTAVNLYDYVMGRGNYAAAPYVERTPEWAAKICGIPPSRIRDLANVLRAKNDNGTLRNISFTTSNAVARQHDMDQWPQIITTLAMITGHVASPGNCCGASGGHIRTSCGNAVVRGGSNCARPTNFPKYNPKIIEETGNVVQVETPDRSGYEERPLVVSNSFLNPLWNEIRINRNELWYAFAEKKYHDLSGIQKPIDIKLLYMSKGERVNQNPDATSAARAFRSMEFAAGMDQFLTPQCQYCDIVMPATSAWERKAQLTVGYPENIILSRQVIEPLFEARDDVWVARQLAMRLEREDPFVKPDWVQPCSPEQDVFNQLIDAEVRSADGSSWEKLITIEADDAARYGAEFLQEFGQAPQQGRIRLKDYEEQGIFHLARNGVQGNYRGNNILNASDVHGLSIEDEAFILGNGVTNPVGTETGKFEIHCKEFVDTMNARNYSRDGYNPNYSENYSPAYTPIPEYRVITEGYEWTFNNRDINSSKGPRPLQYMTLHVQRRAHSSYENTPGLWDIFMHPLYINPIDAAARGLTEGEAVMIEGEAGKTIRNVHISNFIRPGHCAMGQGAWVDLDNNFPGGPLDRAGSTNALFATRRITGQGQMHLQSTPVEVRKFANYPVPAKRLLTPENYTEGR